MRWLRRALCLVRLHREDWWEAPLLVWWCHALVAKLREVADRIGPNVEELSTDETAKALGISVPAVKSRLLRARLKLREQLDRYFRQGGQN